MPASTPSPRPDSNHPPILGPRTATDVSEKTTQFKYAPCTTTSVPDGAPTSQLSDPSVSTGRRVDEGMRGVTVSIRRMTLGSGYRYLMESVARADGTSRTSSTLTAYYTESGTPPGRFLGAGLAGLADGAGVPVGSQVSEQHLFRMLGMLQDPVTGHPLGRAPAAVTTALVRSGDRRAGSPVAGFDLTFSVPKSVSGAWALADPQTQEAAYRAHKDALEFVIGYAERQGVFTSRSGKDGVLQVDIQGVLAAAFDHWDSRAGDPQLHTHVVVLNRVQGPDGGWRTLDSRALFKATVGLSEMYNGVLSDYLTRALGWGWEATGRRHSSVPKYEVAGVPQRLREEFSQRSSAIEEAKNALVARFVQAHGRQPATREVLQMRQRATLDTRPEKAHLRLSDQVRGWRARAEPLLDMEPVAWVASLADRNDLPLLHDRDLGAEILADAGRVAVHTVAEKRATFGRSNVFAEVVRQFHGVRFATAEDRMAVVERTVDAGLGTALLISPPELTHTPRAFQRPDGSSRFRHRGSQVYTTQSLLDAEARLLAAGRDTTGPVLSPVRLGALAGQMSRVDGPTLSADQADAVGQVVTSGRVLDVLVGAAGTGKTTAMAAVRATWEDQFGPGTVTGLAPSAAAAQVLSDEIGIATENTAKWLVEQDRATGRRQRITELRSQLRQASPTLASARARRVLRQLEAEQSRWTLAPGGLVIVDEASLAGTFALDAVVEQALRSGAKVLLVGDPAQLSSVGAGGAFDMLVRDRGTAAELSEVRRFHQQWEKDASLGIRAGAPSAAATYDSHGRVAGGDRESMLDELYLAWQHDTASGLTSLMIAPDAQSVCDLNDRARIARAAAGTATGAAVPLASGGVAGIGDLVVTRRNDRRLTTGGGWVKNGDLWNVKHVAPSGAVTVQRASGSGRVILPATYAAAHLELGYATTAHRAQGRTVDTAHAFVAATTTRESLYVMATRGRAANQLYVDTTYDPDADTLHIPTPEAAAVAVLSHIINTPAAEISATTTISETWTQAYGVQRMRAEYDTIAQHAVAEKYAVLLKEAGMAADVVSQICVSPAFGPLVAALGRVESRGTDVSCLLRSVAQPGGLRHAKDPAAVVRARLLEFELARQGSLSPSESVPIHAVMDGSSTDLQLGLDERFALIAGESAVPLTFGSNDLH